MDEIALDPELQDSSVSLAEHELILNTFASLQEAVPAALSTLKEG